MIFVFYFIFWFFFIEFVWFVNFGIEVNILVIFIVVKYIGRKKVLVFEGGYYGSVMLYFYMKGGDGDDLKVFFVSFEVCGGEEFLFYLCIGFCGMFV